MKPQQYPHPIFRPRDLAEIEALRDRAREISARALELLKASEPDTFFGRKHHPSTPLPEEEELPHERHDALTEALEYIKAGGLIRKYSLVWSKRSEVPRIIIWKATDASDESLRRSIAHSLAGLAAESQVTIEKD